MAAGNIKLQANDLKVATIAFEDGAVGNVNVTVPKEGGELVTAPIAVQKDSPTGAAYMPVGTTAQRPLAPTNGYMRYNTDITSMEVYSNGSWGSVGGGAKGGGSNAVFFENDQTVTTDYTITSGKNAMSAGAITINNGVTVTIPSGSVWTVI